MTEGLLEKYEGKDRLKEFISNLKEIHFIIIGVILFILISLSKNDNSDNSLIYIGIFIVIGILFVNYFKPSKERKIIPEYIAKRIAQDELDKKKISGEEFGFDSKVKITPYCHLKMESDLITGTSGPVAWEIGFKEFIKGKLYCKDGVIRIHPYSGIVTGISYYPFGYSGRESRDRTIVPVGVVEGKFKTDEYGPSKK